MRTDLVVLPTPTLNQHLRLKEREPSEHILARTPSRYIDRGDAMNKIETKSTVLLAHHLKALKLPTMGAECEKVAARAAKDNADHLAFLLQLCELELL